MSTSSPDLEQTWLRRKTLHKERRRHRLTRSVTDEDLDELRGCIDLGFKFEEEEEEEAGSRRLKETFPALDLYYAVNRQREEGSSVSDSSDSGCSSPLSIYSAGDSPKKVKASLKRWAQVVACSVRQHW